jgi:hypothetical protein
MHIKGVDASPKDAFQSRATLQGSVNDLFFPQLSRDRVAAWFCRCKDGDAKVFVVLLE